MWELAHHIDVGRELGLFSFFRVEMISCMRNMASTLAGKTEKIWGRDLVWFSRERITNNDDFGFKRPITKLDYFLVGIYRKS